MKTIVVDLDSTAREDGRLDCAADLARTFGSHIVGVQATPASAYVGFDIFGGVFAMPDVMAAVAEGERRIREAFEAEMAKEGTNWDHVQSDDLPAAAIARQSRVADLVLTGKPGRAGEDAERLGHLGELALTSSAPVLALPRGTRSFDPSRKAAIAWNGSPEASAAVRLALPLLARATDVTVLTAEEADGRWDLPATDIAEFLSRHGIGTTLQEVPVDGGDVPASLLRAVDDLAPAYLVMGAYGRSRARQWLLGGVTRRMLLDLEVPLLLAH